ncbi:hypothetical protein ACQ4PT_070329 [Festuca glaucescens]
MWKGFIGKLSGKAPKSGGGGGWASPLSKSPTSYGANGGQWDPMRSSPPLPVVAGAEGDTREDVFLRKVTVCCVLFDFSTDRGRDSPERERKRQVLVSLVDCIGAAKEPLTEAMVSACVRMFAINLFRVFPPKVRPGAGELRRPMRTIHSLTPHEIAVGLSEKFQEEEEKQAASEERRRLIWEHLERNAAFHPVTGDISFAVLPKSAPLVAPTMT